MMTLKNFIEDGLKDILTFESGVGWIINIKDHEVHENIIKQMCKFKPEDMDLGKEIPPGLFDE